MRFTRFHGCNILAMLWIVCCISAEKLQTKLGEIEGLSEDLNGTMVYSYLGEYT